MNEINETFLTRAAAHSQSPMLLSPAQRWRNGVTDEAVAGLIYAMEAEGVRFSLSPTGSWRTRAFSAALAGVDTSLAMREMIRTGLIRAWADLNGKTCLTLARVHLRDPGVRSESACRAPIAGVPGGRVRIVTDMALVDCLECEDAVAKGGPRKL
jgi:hypothetical protein